MKPIDVFILVQPDSVLLDLAGPAEALRIANLALEETPGRSQVSLPPSGGLTHSDKSGGAKQQLRQSPAFALRFVGAQPQCDSSVGLMLGYLDPLPEVLPADAWLLLLGRPDKLPGNAAPSSAAHSDELRTLRWLRRVGQGLLAEGSPGRLICVCSGTLLAADAGLLNGLRCTTHHELLGELRQRAAQAEVVDNRVFVLDGPLACSAGVTAGIDLTLHLIHLHCGDAVAARVAQAMVVYLRRSAKDPELSPLLTRRNHLHAALHRIQDAICSDPTAEWNLPQMARLAHVTPRHLSRLFGEHIGLSPLHYLQSIRVEIAERAITNGQSTAQAVISAGFSSDQQLRRARRSLKTH